MHVELDDLSRVRRLIVRVEPDRCESLGGYALRVASANRYVTARQVLRSCCHLGYGTYPLHRELAKLAHICRVDEIEIASLSGSWRHMDGKLLCQMHGDWIPGRPHVLGICTRVCSLCLATRVRSKPEWDIALWPVCIEHECLLIQRCDHCGRKLSIHRKGVMECSCGFDLRRSKVHACDPWMQKLVGSGLNSVGRSGRLGHTLRWHWFLGVTFPMFLAGRRIAGAPVLDMKETLVALNAVYGYLNDWPGQFLSDVDRLHQQRFAVSSAEARRMFRRIAADLEKICCMPDRTEVIQRFLAYGADVFRNVCEARTTRNWTQLSLIM